jgi:hypothetical protein
MKDILIFDMDGTIADLYGVPNWLDKIHNEDTKLFENADPIYDMNILNNLVNKLKANYVIVVNTWLPMNATKEYKKNVAKQKKAWLKKHNFPADKIYCRAHGENKAYATKNYKVTQILVDDNRAVRQKFENYKNATNNITINARKNILVELNKLLCD